MPSIATVFQPAQTSTRARCDDPSADTKRSALHVTFRHARSRAGILMMANSLASTVAFQAPFYLAPLLARRCISPASQGALLLGMIVVQPLLFVVTSMTNAATNQRFKQQVLRDEQRILSAKLQGSALCWKNGQIAAAVNQRMLSGHENLARQVGWALSSIARLGTNIGLFAITQTTMAAASPALLGAALLLEGLPLFMAWLANAAVSRAYERKAIADAKLHAHMQLYWDTTTLGPPWTREKWECKYQQLIQEVSQCELARNSLESSIMILRNLPSHLLMDMQLLDHRSQEYFDCPFKMFPLTWLKNLAQTMRAINSFAQLFAIRDSVSQIAQTLKTQSFVETQAHQAIQRPLPMHGEKFTIQQDGCPLPFAALESLQNPKPGRITVRAPNGSGKTALMSKLRQEHGDNSVFVPAAHNIDFGVSGASTGQKVIRILDLLDRQKKRPNIVLMDEWDANLDTENTEKGDRILNSWAETTCVVEVRNKGGPRPPLRIPHCVPNNPRKRRRTWSSYSPDSISPIGAGPQ